MSKHTLKAKDQFSKNLVYSGLRGQCGHLPSSKIHLTQGTSSLFQAMHMQVKCCFKHEDSHETHLFASNLCRDFFAFCSPMRHAGNVNEVILFLSFPDALHHFIRHEIKIQYVQWGPAADRQ